jgi:hypothetical protein
MTGAVHLDEGKYGQMAFRTQEDGKIRSYDRMAAETVLFPRTGYGGTILTSLEVIWEMSAKTESKMEARLWQSEDWKDSM